jgi:membrane protease YdiL (CAAX protease family)
MRQVIWLAAVVTLVGVGAWFGWQLEHAGRPAFWLVVSAPTVALAVVAALRARAHERLGDWLKPKWGDLTKACVSAAALFAVAFLGAKLLAPFGGQLWLLRIYAQLGERPDLERHALLVAGVVAVMAVAEELVWRGLVPWLLEERVGSRNAWVVAAVLYAVAHAPTAWALSTASGKNPMIVLAALAGGLVWGALARFTGRLAPGIVSHALFDWCVVMMFPLLKVGA